MTLEEKVYSAITAESPTGLLCARVAVGSYPACGDELLSPFELDCRDWGFAFGVAYGIARGEDPFEADHQVAERALQAARTAFLRWGGDKIFTTEAFDRDRAERPMPEEAMAS